MIEMDRQDTYDTRNRLKIKCTFVGDVDSLTAENSLHSMDKQIQTTDINDLQRNVTTVIPMFWESSRCPDFCAPQHKIDLLFLYFTTVQR